MNNRLKDFINSQGLSVRQFESIIGSSDGKIAKFIATNSSLKSDTLCRIMELFPQLSLTWLLTGQGEMLQNDAKTPTPHADGDATTATKAPNHELETLRHEITDLRITIAARDAEIRTLRDMIALFAPKQ